MAEPSPGAFSTRSETSFATTHGGPGVLDVENVTRVFGQKAAVDRVSFRVERPGFLGIIGRSGAGKSTFLRMLNRLTDASAGRIRFEGRDVLALKGAAMRAWQGQCAMVFQQFNLVPRMDVASNVLHGLLNRRGTMATLFNLWSREDIERALAILDRLGIAEQAAKRAEALSGGQQQRVAIARALMQDPRVILADEPIASLDPMNAQVVMDALRRIHDEDGRMVIANLHTLDTARRYCDRVIGMRDGRVVFDGTPEQLTTGAARDIYGADAGFREAGHLDRHRRRRCRLCRNPACLSFPPLRAAPRGQQPRRPALKRLLATLAATTALAGAVHAEDAIKEFRIGILGGENAQDRVNEAQCLVKYTTETLGVPVKLFTPADYDGVIQGLLGGTIDMAILGASGYAKTYVSDPNAVEPVLTTANPDGSYVYYSIGFARKDHGIHSLEDAKGKRFGFGDPNSTSGYLIPSIEIPAEIGAPMDKYFGEVKFTGGHEQTIVAVNNGDIDAGVTWADGQGAWEDGFNNGALRKAVDAGLVDMNELVEIWRSKPIPNGPLVLRTVLPQDVKDKMVSLLEGMKDKDADCLYNIVGGDSAGLVPITKDYYDSIIAVRRAQSN